MQVETFCLSHSFAGLEQFIRDSTKPRVNRQFNLNYPLQTYFHGVGGRIVDGVCEHDLIEVQRYKPDAVILEMGCNDLSNTRCSPYDLVYRLTSYFVTLKGLQLLLYHCQ